MDEMKCLRNSQVSEMSRRCGDDALTCSDRLSEQNKIIDELIDDIKLREIILF